MTTELNDNPLLLKRVQHLRFEPPYDKIARPGRVPRLNDSVSMQAVPIRDDSAVPIIQRPVKESTVIEPKASILIITFDVKMWWGMFIREYVYRKPAGLSHEPPRLRNSPISFDST